MAKFSLLEVVSAALFTSAVLWQATSSNPVWSTVTEETLTTTKETSTISLGEHSSTITEETLTTTKGPDVCHGISCPLGKHCVLNTTENLPECVCNEICHFIYDPVCGSDEQTYENDCMLLVEACKTNPNITVEHKGSCNNSCTGFKCPFYGHCVVDTYNLPTCVCRFACPRNHSPVCGSDNKTYDNHCLLQSEACQTKTNITVVHEGICNDTSSSTVSGLHSTTVNEEATTTAGRGN